MARILLDGTDSLINGDAASVTCKLVTRKIGSFSREARVKVTLRYSGERWVILNPASPL